MNYVIGIDLGTSSVKGLLVDRKGRVAAEAARDYPLLHPKSGYSEQEPEEWYQQTVQVIKELVHCLKSDSDAIAGISFSGQMHGLVLLDRENRPLRPAILWNDTRTTVQCREIERRLGDDLYRIAKNPALEGFTLPKLLWVKENEPRLFEKAAKFVLPKDYLRYRLTGELHIDYSDAAGTLLLDVSGKSWSGEICRMFGIEESLCPPLTESHACVGTLKQETAEATGLSCDVKVFAGGADNACGAVGAGILSEGEALCSIGTSGVILTYEEEGSRHYPGNIHFFNHAKEEAYYAMGVTLSAGHSLGWFQQTFAAEESFDRLMEQAAKVPVGSNGLLFAPYLSGERTPHADSVIRASFIGMEASHSKADFVRAVVEGITMSLQESVVRFREAGKRVDSVISIGGGAKSRFWLQLQADVFGTEVSRLDNEQGPGMGAAMLAAYGCGWFSSLEECASQFIRKSEVFTPIPENREKYENLFAVYRNIYAATKPLNEQLTAFRSGASV